MVEKNKVNKNINAEYLKAMEYVFTDSYKSERNKKEYNRYIKSIGALLGFLSGVLGIFLFNFFDFKTSEFLVLVAFLGAGVVSLIVSEQNKENELNKHREKWCCELKIVYSDFLNSINAFLRKSFEGVDKSDISHINNFFIISDNLKNCGKEILEIERLYNLLSLYLLTKENDDAEYRLYLIAESLMKEIKSYEYGFLSKRGADMNLNSGEDLKNFDYKMLLLSLDRIASKEIKEQTLCVKVYLDREWFRIKTGYYEHHLRKTFFYLFLFFLVGIFLTSGFVKI